MKLASAKGLSWFDCWVIFVSLLFLFSGVLDGVIRYAFAPAGLSPLIYLPKALLVCTLFMALMVRLIRGKISRVYLGAIVPLGIFTIVSLVYVGSLIQVLFGLWVLVPLLFGIIAYPTFRRAWPQLKPYIILLWVLAVLGVLLNWRYSLPWVGFDYTLRGVNVEGTLQWTTLGISRLAGFSRRSAEVANQLLMLSAFIAIFGRRRLWQVFVWIVTGIAIYLTTTKTDIGAYVVLTIFLICRSLLPKLFWQFVAALIALVGLVIPFSTLFINYSLDPNGFISRLLFNSFADRLVNTWPQAFKLIAEHGSLILGRGVGGIGTPQKYFETALYNPADNLYLYLYGLFGISMFIVVAAYVYGTMTLDLKGDRLNMLFYMIALVILLAGITTSVLETSFLAFFGGLSARHLALRPRPSRRETVIRDPHYRAPTT